MNRYCRCKRWAFAFRYCGKDVAFLCVLLFSLILLLRAHFISPCNVTCRTDVSGRSPAFGGSRRCIKFKYSPVFSLRVRARAERDVCGRTSGRDVARLSSVLVRWRKDKSFLCVSLPPAARNQQKQRKRAEGTLYYSYCIEACRCRRWSVKTFFSQTLSSYTVSSRQFPQIYFAARWKFYDFGGLIGAGTNLNWIISCRKVKDIFHLHISRVGSGR